MALLTSDWSTRVKKRHHTLPNLRFFVSGGRQDIGHKPKWNFSLTKKLGNNLKLLVDETPKRVDKTLNGFSKENPLVDSRILISGTIGMKAIAI